MRFRFYHFLTHVTFVLTLGSIAWGQGIPLPVLGPDAWFRPRDTVVYYLNNPKGEAVDLTLTLGDLNTYLQGKQGAILWVIGPDGKTLLYERLADDGITSGNFRFKDGLDDVYADTRYRAWVEEAAGLPLLAGKARSALADNPTGLADRHFSFSVPAVGKGLYRVALLSCWDHWVSLESVPPLEAAIASGPGPLALRPSTPIRAWLFAPGGDTGLGFGMLEEVKPYAWRASIKGPSGKVLAATEPRESYNFAVLPTVPKNQALEIEIQPGKNLATFHVKGTAPLLAPSSETAERFRGGRLYSNGEDTFAFPQQVILDRWLKRLSPDDLALSPLTADMVPEDVRLAASLDSLNADLAQQVSPKGEIFSLPLRAIGKNIGILLASETFRKTHPEMTRALALRVAVTCVREARTLDESFSYYVKPMVLLKPGETATFWNTAYRNNWMSFHEAHLSNIVSDFAPQVEAVMPKNVVEAWHGILDLWALARGNASQGECANQWCMILSGMAGVQKITGNSEMLEVLQERIAVMTDPNGLGRTNPLTPRASLGSVAGYGFASDTGMTGSGYLAENFGYDAEYGLEQIGYIHRAWNLTQASGLLEWFNSDYTLKTHLSLPWKAGAEVSTYKGLVSPTDLNFRTTFFTHKSRLPSDAVSQVRYASLWQPGEGSSKEIWPFLDKEIWTRSIDGRFHFLNRGSYYAIVYTGETMPDWSYFRQAESTTQESDGILTGGIRISGYAGMHYKGFGRKSTKPGGISAFYLKGFGTALLSQNLDVPYTNTVWGKRKTPISPVWEEGEVDPYVVAAAYDLDPLYEANPEAGIFIKQERMRYAPVLSSRRLVFGENSVRVELEISALDDLDLTELYESLPLVTRSRSLVFVHADGKRTTVDPKKTAPRELSRETWKITSLELSDESSGGLRIAFSRPVEVRLAGTLPYRDTPLAASVQVILNGAARRGETQQVAYTLTSLKEAGASADN